MELLQGYGMGPDLAILLSHCWGSQHIVPKVGRFLGKVFGMGRGVTQRDPASPMIFNIMVDAVVRAVLEEVCGPQGSQYGEVWAPGEKNLVFYVDDVLIAGREHIWVQDAMTMTVGFFWQMGLENNTEKTKSMVCTPGFL